MTDISGEIYMKKLFALTLLILLILPVEAKRKRIGKITKFTGKAIVQSGLRVTRIKKVGHPIFNRDRVQTFQGTVEVKFTILRNGNVGNVMVNGPKVFHTSARNAVKSAFPIDVKNAPISLPKSINIKLRYQIR